MGLQEHKRRISWIILALLICAVGLAYLSMQGGYENFKTEGFWDFKAQLCAAKTLRAGLNPYRLEDQNKVCPSLASEDLPYIYHPYSLLFFLPFTMFSDSGSLVAGQVVYFLALLIYAALILINFGKNPFHILIWSFLFLFGFQGLGFSGGSIAAYTPGNFSSMEAVLIWGGLLFLAGGKPLPFLILIGADAFVKSQPLLLSLLVLALPDKKRGFKIFAGFCFAYAALWLSASFLSHGVFADYIESLRQISVKEWGIDNQSPFSLFNDSARFYGWLKPTVAWAFTSLFFSSLTFWRARKMSWKENRWNIIFLVLLNYALVCPRFKTYQLLQLLPAFYALGGVRPVFLALPFMFVILNRAPVGYFVQGYFALASIVATWAWLMLSDLVFRSKTSRINTGRKTAAISSVE